MKMLCSDGFCKGSLSSYSSFVIEKENCSRKNFVEETLFRKQKIPKRFISVKKFLSKSF